MNLGPEELRVLSIPGLLRESVAIPRHSPKIFFLITLTLILPLTLAIMADSLITDPILAKFGFHTKADGPPTPTRHGLSDLSLALLLVLQFCFLIFLFLSSLLSTAAVVFTVASLYTKKAVSFSSTISAVPRVFKRLFVTFLWVSLIMVLYNALCIAILVAFIAGTNDSLLANVSLVVISVLLMVFHALICALWQLGSVVSVLEPIYGLAAMKKSYELLRGKTYMAYLLVYMYLSIGGLIIAIFGYVVVDGWNKYGVATRISVGGLLVGVLVIMNLVGLLAQTVFYYVAKSYHHQGIDESALYEQLGCYLGESVPLRSNIQMENFDV